MEYLDVQTIWWHGDKTGPGMRANDDLDRRGKGQNDEKYDNTDMTWNRRVT